jgi:hypothetical protein
MSKGSLADYVTGMKWINLLGTTVPFYSINWCDGYKFLLPPGNQNHEKRTSTVYVLIWRTILVR